MEKAIEALIYLSVRVIGCALVASDDCIAGMPSFLLDLRNLLNGVG